MPISVVVLTKNEESNIRQCLESVSGWADEIIVVDDESVDKTREIVRSFTDRILVQRMENEGRHRNWAYAQTRHEWVLSLDADERVTPELKEEIDRLLPGTSCRAFAVPIRNYIGDYWVRYGGQYPASKLRLFRKDRFRYEEVGIHPRAFVDGPTGVLESDIVHKSYRDFEHLITKLNYQTTLEARKWIETGQKMPRGRVIRRTIDRFFRSFIGKKGYKDGFRGLMFALFASLYQLISYAKYWEIKRSGPEEK